MYRLTEQNNMSTTRDYKKVNDNSGPVWNPKAETPTDFNPEDKANNIIEGYLIDIQHNVGQNKSTIYRLHEVLSDGAFGEIYSVWSNVVLAGSMDSMPLGKFVCIEYLGLKAKKGQENAKFKSGTSHFHNWQVFTDDSALPYKQALNISKGQTNETVEEPVKQSSTPKAVMPVKNSRQAVSKNDTFDDSDLPF